MSFKSQRKAEHKFLLFKTQLLAETNCYKRGFPHAWTFADDATKTCDVCGVKRNVNLIRKRIGSRG